MAGWAVTTGPAVEVLRRRTDAESNGEATGDTAVATTGVAMTTAARCMAKDGVHGLGRSSALASTVGKKNRIGTAPGLCLLACWRERRWCPTARATRPTTTCGFSLTLLFHTRADAVQGLQQHDKPSKHHGDQMATNLATMCVSM